MKKTIRFQTVLLAAMMLFSSFGFCTSAAGVKSATVDNDCLASTGYSNFRRGFTAYVTGSDYYNQDARREYSVNSDSCYGYYGGDSIPTCYATLNVTLGAYLNSSSFTDTATQYYCIGKYQEMLLVKTINQNIAPRGWNTYTIHNISVPNNVVARSCIDPDAIFVYPSGISGRVTGADAVSFRISGT